MARLVDYRDRVAIVTGASSGIGAQLARDLAARGMRVVLFARREERLRALAEEIARAGGAALAVPGDVAERPQVEAAVARTLEVHGRVDLLVNNAGYGRHVLFKDHDVADIERMLRTNMLGQPDEAVYAASKFAVTGLSESLAYELGPLGIHVLAVYPALVRTEMFTPDVLARMPASIPRRFLEPAAFTRHVLRALERGAYEVTVPSYVRIAYLVRLLFPGFFRRQTAKLRLPVLPDLAR